LLELAAEMLRRDVAAGNTTVGYRIPGHFRLGIACETGMLAAGMERLSAVLDTLAQQ
jgi:hypothetical protein